MAGTAHVVGAGLAGLAAATALAEAGRKVVLHESTQHAGGRCRSYRDRALDLPIDNGNHILLSGNSAALSYLALVGAADRVCGPPSAQFDFFDLGSGEKWQLDFGNGRLPWWIFDRRRRVPGTRLRDYLSLAPLLLQPGAGSVAEIVTFPEPLYGRLIQPMLLATLNNEPADASAGTAAAVLRNTVLRGGRSCRPLVAIDGLSAAFVDPALDFLKRHEGTITFGHTLRGLRCAGQGVEALEFGADTIILEPDDAVVLATAPEVAARLLPDLTTPNAFRSIANIHFRTDQPTQLPLMTGLLDSRAQWVFQFPRRVSVTISSADGLAGTDRETLAKRVWSEVLRLAGESRPLPAWQVVHERRATFATVPEQERRRPPARTRWRNLFLAGDWTATGLPPTIEGAIRSGHRAAQFLAAGGRLDA